MKKIVLFLMTALLATSLQAKEVKTMVCMTSDMAPNVDIRVELEKDSAVVKLILFGYDVDVAPTDGPATTVTLKEARDLLNGNAQISFINENNDQVWIVMEKHNGTIAIPNGDRLSVFTIDNCHVQSER